MIERHPRPDHIVSHEDIMAKIRMPHSAENVKEVFELWKAHSIAEDSRDIPGLMATLTDDCVYELMNTGDTWCGHEGATRFYTTLIEAFPDITFHLTDIVIGPQGVCEEAYVVGTQEGPWLHYPPSNELIHFRIAIFFPWDPAKKRFKGEKMYLDRKD